MNPLLPFTTNLTPYQYPQPLSSTAAIKAKSDDVQVNFSTHSTQMDEEIRQTFVKQAAKSFFCDPLSQFWQQLKEANHLSSVAPEEISKMIFLKQVCETQFEEEIEGKILPESLLLNLMETPMNQFTKPQASVFQELKARFDGKEAVLEKLSDRQQFREKKILQLPAETYIPGFSFSHTSSPSSKLLTERCTESQKRLLKDCNSFPQNVSQNTSKYVHNVPTTRDCKLRAVEFDTCLYSSLCGTQLSQCMKERKSATIEDFLFCSANIPINKCI